MAKKLNIFFADLITVIHRISLESIRDSHLHTLCDLQSGGLKSKVGLTPQLLGRARRSPLLWTGRGHARNHNKRPDHLGNESCQQTPHTPAPAHLGSTCCRARPSPRPQGSSGLACVVTKKWAQRELEDSSSTEDHSVWSQ